MTPRLPLVLKRNAQLPSADVLPAYPCFHFFQLGSVAEYLEHGPGFVFLAHPALGPLWQVGSCTG